MEVELQAGRYVIAVSGGIDSVVLLDVLSKRSDLELIVAHYDHGIRDDSTMDYEFVESLARLYGLQFVGAKGSLGPGVSEATARRARYTFLTEVRSRSNALAIITAHHQDDVIETIIINMLRGTGRMGLTSLKSTTEIIRPFIGVTKAQLVDYAHMFNLRWHEDSTNANDVYTRNCIRHNILPRFNRHDRSKLIDIYDRMLVVNNEIDQNLALMLETLSSETGIERYAFRMLPHNVAKEILAFYLRSHNLRQYDSRMLERLVIAIKVFAPGNVTNVYGGYNLRITKETAILTDTTS